MWVATNLAGRSSLGIEVGRSGSWRSNLGRSAGHCESSGSAHAEASECNSLVLPLCEIVLMKADDSATLLRALWWGKTLWVGIWRVNSVCARAGEAHALQHV